MADRCCGFPPGEGHAFERVYRGVRLDVYRCSRAGCNVTKQTPGTLNAERERPANAIIGGRPVWVPHEQLIRLYLSN